MTISGRWLKLIKKDYSIPFANIRKKKKIHKTGKIMEQKKIKKEICGLLETIASQSHEINKNEGKIPQIEIDILMSNIRNLYEKYKMLERLNKNSSSEPAMKEEKIINTEKPVITEISEPLSEEKIMVPEIVQINKEEIIIEKTPAIKEDVVISESQVEEKNEGKEEIIIEQKSVSEDESNIKKVKTKKPDVDLFSMHTTVADKFRDEKKSLNEKLSASHSDKSIAAKLQNNPIKDIKAAVGINEKFKFINELFEGNLQKYNESIEKLNSTGTSESANNFLNVLKQEFSWADDSEVYHELRDLVSRRYL